MLKAHIRIYVMFKDLLSQGQSVCPQQIKKRFFSILSIPVHTTNAEKISQVPWSICSSKYLLSTGQKPYTYLAKVDFA